MRDKKILDDFYNDLSFNIENIDHFISFLNLSDKEKKFYKKALKLLKNKQKNIKKSNSLDELNKHLRVKKLIKDKKDVKNEL